MLYAQAHLKENIFDTPDQAATRDGFGNGVVEAAREDARIVVLTADLSESTRVEAFAKEFPTRFIEVGVAEQNMAALASGIANYGKIPCITSYATFSPGRNWEQIRTTIAIPNLPVVIAGMHAGVSVGPDGATHQALEDVALMRALPHMTVISPCDATESYKATRAAVRRGSPVYLRFSREKSPIMTNHETPFEVGKANVMWSHESPQVAVFATGPLLYQALLAARELEAQDIGTMVVNVHTIKPLDEETILRSARQAGVVVIVEEHQVSGGLGGAIAELLARTTPLPIEFIGAQDRFGQSGKPSELLGHYGMDSAHIVEAARRSIERKSRGT